MSQSTTLDSPAAADGVLPRELRCEYPSKHCSNRKAFKPKGGLHKLCDDHRRKANLNQKRWQQRKREQRESIKCSARANGKAPGKAKSPASSVNETVKMDPSVATPLGSSMEPFPISDFTTTPPPSSSSWHPMSSFSNIASNFSHAGTSTSGFPVGDDLEVLSTMLFNTPGASHHPLPRPNWAPMGTISDAQSTSGYTLTSDSSAIV